MARRIAAAQMAAAALAQGQAPLSYGIATEDPPDGGAGADRNEAQRAAAPGAAATGLGQQHRAYGAMSLPPFPSLASPEHEQMRRLEDENKALRERMAQQQHASLNPVASPTAAQLRLQLLYQERLELEQLIQQQEMHFGQPGAQQSPAQQQQPKHGSSSRNAARVSQTACDCCTPSAAFAGKSLEQLAAQGCSKAQRPAGASSGAASAQGQPGGRSTRAEKGGSERKRPKQAVKPPKHLESSEYGSESSGTGHSEDKGSEDESSDDSFGSSDESSSDHSSSSSSDGSIAPPSVSSASSIDALSESEGAHP